MDQPCLVFAQPCSPRLSDSSVFCPRVVAVLAEPYSFVFEGLGLAACELDASADLASLPFGAGFDPVGGQELVEIEKGGVGVVFRV